MSAFIDEHRARFGVEPICRTLDVSASAYYQRATGQRSARAVGDEWLLERIERLHTANYHAYGYRRTWLALRREGVEAGRDRVKRLMRAHGIQGAKRRGKPWRTTIPDPAAIHRARSRAAPVHRRSTGSVVGRGLHLPALLGRRGLLQLRPGRLRSAEPAEHSLSLKRGNQQIRSPRNPARLTSSCCDDRSRAWSGQRG